jgi:inner membrane protein involved in colicin E2 resistance
MRKIAFYLSLGISIILLINIIKILITDLNRLTEYGFGYLAGKVLLFIVFTFIMFITRKHIVKYKSEQ